MIFKYIILAGSIFALGFALFSQYVQGYHPCEMCIWQRWVYSAVILFSLLALKKRKLAFLVSIALAAQVALALFHTGVELKWWEGFSTCSSGLKTGSLEELKAQIMGAPVVRCDEATWLFLGLSMAAWNAIYAAFLFMISLIPCRKSI